MIFRTIYLFTDSSKVRVVLFASLCKLSLLIFFLSIDSLLLGIPITKTSFAIVTRSSAETLSSSLIFSGSSLEGKKHLTGRCLLMKSESDLEQIMLIVMILISYKCDIIHRLILCDQK